MKDVNKDTIYAVLKEPTMENFRVFIKEHMGEEDKIDFKTNWESDEKMAKHLLAMANSGGGCIIFGVKQNDDGTFSSVGLETLKDKADFNRGVKKFIPETLKYDIKDFNYDNSEYDKLINKKFQILLIEDEPKNLPYICCKDGSNIKDGDIYVRVKTESRKASNEQVKEIIERQLIFHRLKSDSRLNLEDHLNQIKVLYKELTYEEYENQNSFLLGNTAKTIKELFIGKKIIKKKEKYPKEDYDDYIAKVIEKKKRRIEEELDI